MRSLTLLLLTGLFWNTPLWRCCQGIAVQSAKRSRNNARSVSRLTTTTTRQSFLRSIVAATAGAVTQYGWGSAPAAWSMTTEEEESKRQEEIRQKLLERRKLMEASRSSNNRQSYLDLSKQRASLYNTTYRGVTCPPNIPCLWTNLLFGKAPSI